MKTYRFLELPTSIITEKTKNVPFTTVMVFGAGGRGAAAIECMLSLGVKILGVLDNDPKKQGMIFNGYRVYGPGEVDLENVYILIASAYEYEIALQLRFKCEKIFNVCYFRLESEIAIPYIILSHLKNIESVHGSLADDESRERFMQLFKVFAFPHWNGSARSEYPQYRHPVVRPLPGDTILDLGAFSGDTAVFFAELTGNDCMIYSFEPSVDHQDRFLSNTGHLGEIVELVPFGTWSHKTSLSFDTDFPTAMSGSYRVDQEGTTSISVIDIDSFVAKRGLSVDLMKMDVEGSELQTLVGAKNTISRFRPRLQVSIYHKPSDLWEIKEYIDSIAPGYIFYVGHHSHVHTETVLYCCHAQDRVMAAPRDAKSLPGRVGA